MYKCVLNCDPGAALPRIPKGQYPGHCWKDVVHDDSVTWLAYYFQSSRNEFKYEEAYHICVNFFCKYDI